MSVPLTHTQHTVNPDKMAVTNANNPQAQQADVERKLKLYGVIQAFRDGRMPDNQQINEALDFAIKHSPVELQKLSPDGKLLVEDVRDILESARMMISEKNQGELFQNFIYATTQGDITRGAKSKDQLLPVGKDEATAQAKQGAAHLRVLLTLFATNSEARKLLSDFGYIARDIFASGAAKAAEKVRPDQEKLDQVDKTAPSGEFISEDGRRVGKDETPVLHVKGPSGTEVRMNPKDDPANAQVTDHQGNTRTAGETANIAQQKINEAKEAKDQAKAEAKNQAQSEYNNQGGAQGLKEQAKSHASDIANSNSPMDAARAKKDQALNEADRRTPNDVNQDNAQGQAQRAKDKVLGQIPDEHREKLDNAVNETKDFFKEQFPQERRDNFIYRLKKVVVECQEHKDYQEAMSFFLDIAENYKGHAKTVAGQGADSAQKVAEDPAYNHATLQFRTLLERFANNQSMQPMIDSIDNLYSDAANDSELRKWWSKVNDYIHAALLEPGFLLDDDSDRQARQLNEEGKHFFEDKYKGHFETFGDETQRFFLAMGDDPLNQRFGEDWKRLTKDLLFDANGDLSYKPALWNDIRRVVLPSLVSSIGYVPIPRAEYEDKNIELVIENLVLQGENLFPSQMLVELHNKFEFSPLPNIHKQLDTHNHSVRIQMSQIQADIRDVQFALRRKTGWPKIKDAGLADVVIAGKGITIDVHVESVANKRDQVIRVKNVDVDIDTMKWSIKDSRHQLLYKILSKTATGVIKKAIEAAIHQAIRTGIEYLDDQLVEVRNKMDEAKRDDNELTRTQALKDLYSRKKETTKQNAQKADEKTGTFKLVVDPKDSIVRDLDEAKAKHSWTKSAFHVTDAARAGQDWKSPVFSLFSQNHPAVTGSAHPVAKAQGTSRLDGTGTGVATHGNTGSHTGSNVTH